VTQQAGEFEVERRLSAILEACRAVSGLATILILAVILMGVSPATEVAPAQRIAPDPVAPDHAPLVKARPQASQVETAVVYLVRTAGQERLAVSSEAERALGTPLRPQHVLYVRGEDDLTHAGEALLELARSYPGMALEVVDLRNLE
jgi:hypothetical protein